jgi:hypothetical protein
VFYNVLQLTLLYVRVFVLKIGTAYFSYKKKELSHTLVSVCFLYIYISSLALSLSDSSFIEKKNSEKNFVFLIEKMTIVCVVRKTYLHYRKNSSLFGIVNLIKIDLYWWIEMKRKKIINLYLIHFLTLSSGLFWILKYSLLLFSFKLIYYYFVTQYRNNFQLYLINYSLYYLHLFITWRNNIIITMIRIFFQYESSMKIFNEEIR